MLKKITLTLIILFISIYFLTSNAIDNKDYKFLKIYLPSNIKQTVKYYFFPQKYKKQVEDKIQLYVQPIPSIKTSGMVNEYLIIDIQKDFITKLVSASIKLLNDSNYEISFPDKIQCRINYQNPNLELFYRGISMSATILPRHVAEHHKYMLSLIHI